MEQNDALPIVMMNVIMTSAPPPKEAKMHGQHRRPPPQIKEHRTNLHHPKLTKQAIKQSNNNCTQQS